MNKKGVSPVIATLLLIVIAVAAAVVTYTFVMGFVGTSTASASTAQGQLTYDAYKVVGDTSNSNITIYLRNNGGKSVIVDAVYVAGVQYTYSDAANESGKWNITSKTIDVGSVVTLFINSSGKINPAQWNEVKVICTDGTTLILNVRK